jgi:hypothetical protein
MTTSKQTKQLTHLIVLHNIAVGHHLVYDVVGLLDVEHDLEERKMVRKKIGGLGKKLGLKI